jgi:hypothetical protein
LQPAHIVAAIASCFARASEDRKGVEDIQLYETHRIVERGGFTRKGVLILLGLRLRIDA